MFKMKCVATEYPYNSIFTEGEIYINFDGQFSDSTGRVWTDRERLNSIDKVNKEFRPFVKFELVPTL